MVAQKGALFTLRRVRKHCPGEHGLVSVCLSVCRFPPGASTFDPYPFMVVWIDGLREAVYIRRHEADSSHFEDECFARLRYSSDEGRMVSTLDPGDVRCPSYQPFFRICRCVLMRFV